MIDDVEHDIKNGDNRTDTAPAAANWTAIGGVAAMLVCCLGHGLLMAFGAAGFAAAVGGAVGSPVVVIGAVVVFAAAGALIALRLRRRSRRPASHVATKAKEPVSMKLYELESEELVPTRTQRAPVRPMRSGVTRRRAP